MTLEQNNDFVRDHVKAVNALKYLNDYCNGGGCTHCTFESVIECPFHILLDEQFDKLKKKADKLSKEK